MQRLLIGSEQGEHVVLEAPEPTQSVPAERDDANWIACRITVNVLHFRGDVHASVRSEDFPPFLGAVRALHGTLAGEAVFDTMEGWLSLTLAGNGRGAITVAGTLRSCDSTDTSLTFRLAELDQTFLPPIITQLEAWVKAFPVVGRAAV